MGSHAVEYVLYGSLLAIVGTTFDLTTRGPSERTGIRSLARYPIKTALLYSRSIVLSKGIDLQKL